MVELTNSSINVLNTSENLPFDFLPVGAICMWPHNDAPTNWLLCEGQAVSRSTYSYLFNLIGTTFGAGNGSTTFNVPNFKVKHPIGVGTMSLADSGGTINHSHTVNHNHAVTTHNHSDLVHNHTSNHIHTYSHSHTIDHNHTFAHTHSATHSHGQSTTSAANIASFPNSWFGTTGANSNPNSHTHTASFASTTTTLANAGETSATMNNNNVSDTVSSNQSSVDSSNDVVAIPDSDVAHSSNENISLGVGNIAYLVIKYIVKVK